MFEKIEKFLCNLKMKTFSLINEFENEEKGAADMVAVIVLIVVVIAIATVFRTQLSAAVTSVFEKLTNFINTAP